MPRENGFENKRVVIVGGSSGIGFAVAEEAASLGAKVVIVSSKAELVQEAIHSNGGDAGGQVVDVLDERALESFFTKVGAFDHLVFTAGDSLRLHELAVTDLNQARQAFELRYWSALATVKYGSPRIRKGGSVVLTTGIAGRRPQSGWVICKCLWNDRSVDPCPGDRVGPDPGQRGIAGSRPDDPLAEPELSRKGRAISERGQACGCGASRQSS